MKQLTIKLMSETPGLEDTPFPVVIIWDEPKEQFWVKTEDDWLDITHALTDTQLETVVNACEQPQAVN